MLKAFNKMFIETLKLTPDMWLYILLAVIGVAFVVTLVLGLASGDFKRITSLMRSVAAKPDNAVAFMKQMPVGVKKNYKRARTIQVGGISPSDFLTQEDCVESPYRRSLISKVWLVTLIATVVCAALAYVIAPLSCQAAIAMVESGKLAADKLDEAVLLNAPYLMPTVVLIVGGLLTLIGGILGRVMHGSAVKAYTLFLPALDGKKQQRQAATSTPQATSQNFAFERQSEPTETTAAPVYEAAEPTVEPMYQAEPINAQPVNEQVYEPVVEEPTVSPVVEPVVMAQPAESEEDIRRKAREEAMARARQEQEMRAAQAAQAQAQAAAQAQARASAPTGSSSADDVIARIEQINREGAPRETMREVATLLQKERAKPENKTPEQQKKLNDALSKLLKAMSAATRK